MSRVVEKKYKVIDTAVARLGRFCVHLDTVCENGKNYPYSFVEQKNSVGVLAFAGDRLVLIRQYRHALGSYEYEIPGGSIDEGEVPLAAAQREMLEETGYKADFLEMLGVYYPSPGSTNECCYLFWAKCQKAQAPSREPLEYMSVELLPENEFQKMIFNDTFRHSMGLVAWLKYSMKRGKR